MFSSLCLFVILIKLKELNKTKEEGNCGDTSFRVTVNNKRDSKKLDPKFKKMPLVILLLVWDTTIKSQTTLSEKAGVFNFIYVFHLKKMKRRKTNSINNNIGRRVAAYYHVI